MNRAPASALLVTAGLCLTREARADAFQYTDRSGRTHRVEATPLPFVRAPAREADLAPAPAAAAPAAAPPAPAALAPAPSAEALVLASMTSPGPALAAAPAPGDRLPVVPAPAAPPPLEPPTRSAYYPLIQEAAALYSLPVELVLAVVKVESNFNPLAVSRRGAQGLMQLMPATAADLGVTDAFDPRQNVFAGARYLRALINEFDGQLALAVAAYNAGAGAVRRAGGIPPIAETVAYVPAVLAAYHAYQARPRVKDAPSW